MSIAGHSTQSMQEHYAPVDAAEKLEAGRRAFGGLRVSSGGKDEAASETATQTGTFVADVDVAGSCSHVDSHPSPSQPQYSFRSFLSSTVIPHVSPANSTV